MAVLPRWQESGATPGGFDFELMIPFVLVFCVLFALISMLRKPRDTKGRDKDRPNVDEKLLLCLSKEIGRNWTQLAINVSFGSADIDAFKHDHRDNLVEQCRAMLVAWWRTQPNEEEARQRLMKALEETGRMDLVELVEESSSGNLVPDAAERCQRALKRLYTTTGSYVQMLPWVDDDKKHIMDIYTKLHMLRVKDDNTEGKIDSYGDMFRIKTKDGHLIKRVVCEGQAGLGKTTLLDKIAYDWATGNKEERKQFKLVFSLKFSALSHDSDFMDAIFDQLLAEDANIERFHLRKFIENYPDQVLVLLDGFDELMTTGREGDCGTVLKLLNRKVGGECFVIVTTRPSHSAKLKSQTLIEKPFTLIKVMGFAEENVNRYVSMFYAGERGKGRGLLDRIKTSSLLQELVKSPMLLLLMCLLWNESNTLPETMSRLYSMGIQYLFRRKGLDVIKDAIIKLGKVGFDGLISPTQTLSFLEQEFNKDVLDVALKAGVLTRQRVRKGLAVYYTIQFIHKTFQEYCAAKYCQYLLVNDPRKFHSTLVDCDVVAVEYLLRFCCGESVDCTDEVLRLLVEKQLNIHDKRRLGLVCFHESQSKVLPSEEFLNLAFDKCLKMGKCSGEETHSFLHLLKIASDQNNEMVERVEELSWSNFGVSSLTTVQVEQLIGCMPNISDLQLSFNENLGGKGASWSGFNQMRRLMKLTLSHCSLTDKDWKAMAVPLSRLPNLIELTLTGNTDLGGTGDSWSSLKELKQLQKLNVSFCSLKDEDWRSMAESLSAMPNLSELDLSDNRLHRSAVVSWSLFKELKSLRKLILRGCSLTMEDLKSMIRQLIDVPGLTEMDLSHNWHLGGRGHSWSHVKELRRLQKLIVCSCSLDGEDLISVVESLGTLPNFAELDISDNVSLGDSGKSWSHLMEMQKLQKLKLSCCSLRAGDLKDVAEPLSNMPSLSELDLSRNWHLGGVSECWAELKGMKYLHTLVLSRCSLTAVDLKAMAVPLSSLPNLTELDLSGNRRLHSSAASWSHLKAMKHLRRLALSGCSLTGEDLKDMSSSLCSLSNLSELDLSDNQELGTAVESWSYLKELNNLQRLIVL